MQRRACSGCGQPLAYGAPTHRRYHTVACRRRDTALERLARERGLSASALLAALLNETGSPLGVALRLGVDEVTVRRWARHYHLRRLWGDGVVYVPVVLARRRRQARPAGQLTLL